MSLPRPVLTALIGAILFTLIGWGLLLAIRYAVAARMGASSFPPLASAMAERAVSTAIVGALIGLFYGAVTPSRESGSIANEPTAADVESRLKRDLARQLRNLGPGSTAAQPAPVEPPQTPKTPQTPPA